MKVYIAGPMTGLPEDNFPAFHAAAAAWRAAGWEVLNPAESFEGARGLPYKRYVEHDINLLKQVDAIALLPGWDAPKSRGSVWEWGIARQFLGIAVFNAEEPVAPDPTTWF
jgi:nucleoside 2-deoxyribosyltransferase